MHLVDDGVPRIQRVVVLVAVVELGRACLHGGEAEVDSTDRGFGDLEEEDGHSVNHALEHGDEGHYEKDSEHANLKGALLAGQVGRHVAHQHRKR